MLSLLSECERACAMSKKPILVHIPSPQLGWALGYSYDFLAQSVVRF